MPRVIVKSRAHWRHASEPASIREFESAAATAFRTRWPPQFGQASNGNRSGCMPRVVSDDGGVRAGVLRTKEVAAGVMARIAEQCGTEQHRSTANRGARAVAVT